MSGAGHTNSVGESVAKHTNSVGKSLVCCWDTNSVGESLLLGTLTV